MVNSLVSAVYLSFFPFSSTSNWRFTTWQNWWNACSTVRPETISYQWLLTWHSKNSNDQFLNTKLDARKIPILFYFTQSEHLVEKKIHIHEQIGHRVSEKVEISQSPVIGRVVICWLWLIGKFYVNNLIVCHTGLAWSHKNCR